jgi:hypothetical protein
VPSGASIATVPINNAGNDESWAKIAVCGNLPGHDGVLRYRKGRRGARSDLGRSRAGKASKQKSQWSATG